MGFTITQRQYDIIIDHVKKNYPYEAGGFVGGLNNQIRAVLPVLNQDISNKQDVFAVFPQDIERAHLFFQKHGLVYFGIYHSHPKGAAIPSQQDLTHVQKHLFIISLRHFEKPDFAAFQVVGHQRAERVDLTIVSDQSFSVKDIQSSKSDPKSGFVGQNIRPDYGDTQFLSKQLDNIFDQRSEYKKDYRHEGDSGDFSTLA